MARLHRSCPVIVAHYFVILVDPDYCHIILYVHERAHQFCPRNVLRKESKDTRIFRPSGRNFRQKG